MKLSTKERRSMMDPRFVPENYIDDSLVKCFSPIYKLQRFLGSSRINIRNKFVLEPSVTEKLYTLICIVAVSLSFCYFEMYYYMAYHDKDTTLVVACVIGALAQHASCLFNIINIRFSNSVLAVKIYLKLQKLDNIISLMEFENLKAVLYYWNIVALLFVIIPFQCGFIVHVVATVDYPILSVFAGMGLLNVYLELVLAGSLLYYLTVRLRFLNKIIKYNLRVKHGNCEIRRKPLVVNERFMISSDLDDNKKLGLDKFLLCLKEILKLYKIITEVFSFPVFNITATLFFWALLVIQAIIIGLRTKLLSTIVIVTVSLWILLYILLLTALALVSDHFIQEVRQTKLQCIQAMSYRLDGPIWKGANDVLRTIDFYQPAFSVYGIFVLDKTLPLKVIGIITTNVVVLLQFTMQI